MNLSQELLIKIGAQDNASKVIEGVKKTAYDSFSGTRGLSFFANNASFAVAGIATAAVGAGAALVALTMKVAAQGAAWKDMSDRTGISAEKLSALGFAADQTGTDMGTVETALNALARKMGEAASGTGDASDAFNTLGVTIKNSDGTLRDRHDVFVDIGKALEGVTGGTDRAVLAQKTLGNSGIHLLPMLRDIEELEGKAKSLGVTFSDEAAAKADELDDAVGELKAAFTGLQNQIGTAMIPAMTTLVKDGVTPAVSVLGEAVGVAGRLWETMKKGSDDTPELVRGWTSLSVTLSSLWGIVKSIGQDTEDILIPAMQTSAVEGSKSATAIKGPWDALVNSISPFMTNLPANSEAAFTGMKTKVLPELEGVKGKWELVETTIKTGVTGLPDKMQLEFKSGADKANLEIVKIENQWTTTVGSLKFSFDPMFKDLQGRWPQVKAVMDTIMDPVNLKVHYPTPKTLARMGETALKDAIAEMKPLPEADSKKLWENTWGNMGGSDLATRLEKDFNSLSFKNAWQTIGDYWGATAGKSLQDGVIKQIGDAFGSGVSASAAAGVLGAAVGSGIVQYGIWVVSNVLGGFKDALGALGFGGKYTPKTLEELMAEAKDVKGGPSIAPSETPGGPGYVDRPSGGDDRPPPQPQPEPLPSGTTPYDYRPLGNQILDESTRRAAEVGYQLDFTPRDPWINHLKGYIDRVGVGRFTISEAVDWLREDLKERGLIRESLYYAHGGLIDRPTMAVMGEAGPEYVVPNRALKFLESLTAGDPQGYLGGTSKTVYINVNINTPMDQRGIHEFVQNDLGPIVRDYLLRESERGVDVVYQKGVRAA